MTAGQGRVPVRLWQGGLALAGLGALWTAVARAGLGPPDLWYDPVVLPPGATGAALLLLTAAWRSAWRASAALFGLAVVGQASMLQMIDAPRYAIYQHFIPWHAVPEASPYPVVVLILQACICVFLVVRAWPSLKRTAFRILRPWQVIVLAAFLAFAIMVPTESASRAAGELGFAAWMALVALANLALIARAAPADSMRRTAAWIQQRVTFDSRSDHGRWDAALPWLAAAWVVLLAGLASWFVFERVPHIDDSVSNLFQAKYLSAGHLYLPAPPDSASFHVAETIVDGPRWFGYGFPGWPAVLAIGAFFGLPWLVNPLLGGVAVLLTHRLIQSLYERGTANAAVALLCLSPWLIFTSGSFMGHPVSLVWGLTALVAVDRERQRHTGAWGVVAGAAIGALFLTRPIEALLVGGVAFVWMLGWRSGERGRFRSAAAFAASAAGIGVLVFMYNAALTGDPMYAPQMMWTDRTWGPGVDRLGFGPSIGIPVWTNIDPLPGHGLADVVLNANKNFFMANFELFGWACGSLLLAGLFVLFLPKGRADWLMIALVGAVIMGHSAYWFSGGPDLGPRYWYQALIPLVALTVRGAQAVAQRVQTRDSVGSLRIGIFVAAACVSAVVTVLPWRSATKHYRYRDVGGEVRQLAAEHQFDHALVFVRSRERDAYQSAFSLNPPTLADSATIYARDAGRARRQIVVEHFADRPVWVIGRTGSEKRLRVLAGPLQPGTVPPDSITPLPR